ncbi:MAG: tetraacyldisaccharide 4'-kinase [Deltaproteobacteria bacterium]|nr:tetraacyldisaccharide 4'-kinase [Deltaproteobacteria bacterium]MBW2338978.1 tetraacyldisaccharide 4'-kinase [Deltaproteobacteria bacterium]
MKWVNWLTIQEKKQGNALTFFLRTISFFYGIAVRLRLIAYKAGFFRIEFLPACVVSVGNITVGGTGKTPFVAMLAEWASENGIGAAILSRGYKGKTSHNFLVVSDGTKVMATYDDAGDEAVLMAKKVSSIPVLTSKNRYLIGHLALRRFNPELLLLDDGYQHVSLHRDLDILLLDARRQFGNEWLLPCGPLREPLEGIERADLIVMTKCAAGCNGNDMVDFLRKNFPEKPIFRSAHLPDQVIFPLDGRAYPPDFLSGKKVVAFAGLAHPDDFLDMVKGLGANVVHFKAFSDHHSFTQDEIGKLASCKKVSEGDFLLTTEKDWVRIDGRIDVGVDIAVLTIKVGLLSDSDIFFDTIKQGILDSGVKKR